MSWTGDSRRLLLTGVLMVLAYVLWAALAPAPASAANPGADIEQCRNGTFAAPAQCTGSAWQTGNAGASNSHYREGDSVPFRAKLINLADLGQPLARDRVRHDRQRQARVRLPDVL